MKNLKNLLGQLALELGKTTQWQVLCKERGAKTVEEQIAIAESVLHGPPISTVRFASLLTRLKKGDKS